jgi:hypothetical protein
MSDFIPGSDADFRTWLLTFTQGLGSAAPAAFGLVAADVTDLQGLFDAFSDALQSNDTIQAQAQSARAEKDEKRLAAEDRVRSIVARIQAHPAVTDAQRTLLGITVRSASRTTAGPPQTRPVATVDTSQRLQHTINFVDELTPNSRAKPDGVQACEIWVKVDGPPPTGESELAYVATDTRTPYVAEYDGSDGGKVAHYMLRWVNRGGEGPWSQTVSATITK